MTTPLFSTFQHSVSQPTQCRPRPPVFVQPSTAALEQGSLGKHLPWTPGLPLPVRPGSSPASWGACCWRPWRSQPPRLPCRGAASLRRAPTVKPPPGPRHCGECACQAVKCSPRGECTLHAGRLPMPLHPPILSPSGSSGHECRCLAPQANPLASADSEPRPWLDGVLDMEVLASSSVARRVS
jgi:hypothetical protein